MASRVPAHPAAGESPWLPGATETEAGLQPGSLFLDSEPPNWDLGNLIIAYADMTVLFTDFARKSERQPGLSLLDYLQEQALAFISEDTFPADYEHIPLILPDERESPEPM
jgi:hypothetical protein